MRFLLFRFVVLLVVASSICLFSGGDFCGTDWDNITMIDPEIFDPQMGNANLLRGALRQAWPIAKDHRIIHYCYINQQARDALGCRFRDAIDLWQNHLGGRASQGSGHSLIWMETIDVSDRNDLKPKFCYDASGQWNPAVPPDTLAIHLHSEEPGTPAASVGYVPDHRDNTPGRHMMILPMNCDLERVAHEVRRKVDNDFSKTNLSRWVMFSVWFTSRLATIVTIT